MTNLIHQLATAIRTEAARQESPDSATIELFANAVAALAKELGMQTIAVDEDGDEVEVEQERVN